MENNDYIQEERGSPEEPQIQQQHQFHVQDSKFSFFDSLNNTENEISLLKQQLEPQDEHGSEIGCNNNNMDFVDGDMAEGLALTFDAIGLKTKLFNKTGDIRAMKGFGEHREDGQDRQGRAAGQSPGGTRESATELRKNSPSKSANFVFEHGRDQNSDTSSQLARNLQAFGGNEGLRQRPGEFYNQVKDTACQQSEDEDQPSLQSPDPKLVEFRSIQQNQEQEEKERLETPEKAPYVHQEEVEQLMDECERTKISHVIKGLRHQEACRPATAAKPVPQCHIKSNHSSNATPRRSVGPRVLEGDDAAHLTESPELAKSRRSSFACNQEQEVYQQLAAGRSEQLADFQRQEHADPRGFEDEPAPHDAHGIDSTIRLQHQPAKRAPQLHRSEQKGARPRKVMDNSYAYHEDIGDGLLGAFADTYTQDAKTPIKKLNKTDHRGRSANQASYNGSIPQAALQAHMEQMLMRQQQQALSPFSSNAPRNAHFDSIQNLPYQQQLSPFYANNLMNSVCKPNTNTDLTPGTPRSLFKAEQLSQYNAMSQLQAMQGNPLVQSMHMQNMHYGLAQQLAGQNPQERESLILQQQNASMTTPMHPMMPSSSSTGHQYEMLLKEKTDLQNQLQQLGQSYDEQRKQVNQLNAQVGRIKFQLSEKDEDLEETLQTLQRKETMLQDVKDTLRRQNEQIEQIRNELEQSLRKERQSNTNNETLRRENRETKQKLDAIQKELDGKRAAMSKDGEVNEPNQKDKANKDHEELLQSKMAEIYQLTVELGCIREENNELKGNVKMQQVDFSDRFNEQRKRLDDEYCKLQEQFEYYKIESQEAFKDSQTTIIEYSDKIKDLEGQLGGQKKLLEDQNGKHLDDAKELRNQLESLKKQLEEKMVECAKLNEAGDIQQQELDQLTANNQRMKSQMEKIQEELGNEKKSKQVLIFNQGLDSNHAALLDQHPNGDHTAEQEAEARRQSGRVVIGNLDCGARPSCLEDQQLVRLRNGSDCGQEDGHQRWSGPADGSKQLWPTHDAADRGKQFNEDQHQRARILESPSSSKAGDFQTDNDKYNRKVNHQISVPSSRELQSRIRSKEQTSQEQRVTASQLAEPAGADARHPQGAHPWLPSRGPVASQEDVGGACPSATALSGRGGETAQYNPVDTPLGSQGHKYSESRRGAAGGHLFDRDSPQRFGGLHLCHSLDKCSSPGESQLTPFNRAQENREQYLLMFGNREQKEVDGLECTQPLAAEHIPKRTSQVELDASLWERDDGLMATAQREEDLMLQEQTGEFTDAPFELNNAGDQREMMQDQWSSGAAGGTGSLPEDPTGAQAAQAQTTSAAARGSGRFAQKMKAQTANYLSKTSSTINRDQALLSSRSNQRSRLPNNKSNTGNASMKSSQVEQAENRNRLRKNSYEDKFKIAIAAGGQVAQTLTKERSRSKSGRDTNALKSSSRGQCTSTGSNRRNTGPEQLPTGEGVGPEVDPTRASPAPEKSNAAPSTTVSSGMDQKLKKTPNARPGQQKEAKPSFSSLQVGGVSGGPTGPLGVGSRLVAQRRKQQSTAGAMLAEMAPKRPSRVVAGPSFISGSRGSANAKTTAKQRLGITQTNTQLNSSCSQSSQRNSVVDTLNYRSKGLQSSAGQASKGGPGGGHTIASRAKALPAATRLLSRDLSQGEFAATTNFSQNFQTARQFLSRSPRPSGLRSSASFGRMLARESLQSRDQLLERARQQTPHLQMSAGLESPSQLRGCPGRAMLGQQAQTDRGDPFTDASNRMTTQMSAHDAGIEDQVQEVSDSNDHVRYGKAMSSGGGLAQVAVKALAASTQNPKTLKNLQGHEGNSSQSNQVSSGNEGGGQNANCVTSRVHTSGTVLLPAANPGFLTSRAGGDQADDDQTKENMTDMRQKLQSIQTGKAYLEKKIQEYEARLQQMKIKKDKSEKSRGSLMMAPNTSQSHKGLGPSTQGAGMHTSRAHLRDSTKLYQL